MKVLLVSPLPPPEGGIATWTQRILGSTALKGVALHHLDTSLRGGHDRFGAVLPARILRSVIPLPKFLWACLRLRPSVVHLTISGFPGYYRDMFYIFFARILGRRILVNLRFGDVRAFSQRLPGLLQRLVIASLRACWCVVPITQPMADAMRGLGCRRVRVIPNCVDLRDAPGANHDSARGRPLRVLYVGWVIPAKGITELLRAVAQVNGAMLTIIGPVIQASKDDRGGWVGEIITQLHLDGRVALAGRVEAEVTRRAYREHDVLVLPSHQEGFSNVILEAMEAGIPAIATRVGATPEILRDSIDGFLVEVGDVGGLVDRLRWLKDHPDERMRMGQSARKRVAEHYSVEQVAQVWLDLYQCAANAS